MFFRYRIETTVYPCQSQQLATSAWGMVQYWAQNDPNEDFHPQKINKEMSLSNFVCLGSP